jgi:polyvinyl alcohol dehydrogenase (cytochrome)
MLRVFVFAFYTSTLFAQDGMTIYKARCAGCHDAPVGRVPTVTALRAMTATAILSALDTGVMKMQASGLTEPERKAVSAYLSKTEASSSNTPANVCKENNPDSLRSGGGSAWSKWGVDSENTRFQKSGAAGLTSAQAPRLKLRWAFGLSKGGPPRSQPAVAFGRIFIGDDGGEVYSLDAQSGCTHWIFRADAPVRSGIVIDLKRQAVFFGDQHANAYGVSASTGRLLWKRHVEEHSAALITATPVLENGILYVAVSSFEEAMAASPKYACCSFRGSVVALNDVTGAQIWKTYTTDEAAPAQRGPSGAAVWSTPTYDEKRNLLYVATGDNYSGPSTPTSDAVLALEAKTGKLVWTQQATSNDIYNIGCDAGVKSNCPAGRGHDFDFGQPPMLVSLGNEKRALIIGQKSGFVHAFDPDANGKPMWNRRIAEGGALGGIQWGSAAESGRVYVAVSDIRLHPVPDSASAQGFRLLLDPTKGGGLFALNAVTGEIIWSAQPPSCGDKKNCSPAQSAPVSAIPGVVFSGSVDGHLRAYSAGSGYVLWDVDTRGEYDVVNGGKARGGSLDVTGPVIVGGMLYVTSGYGQWGGVPGNVLLAYSIAGR